MKIDQNYWKGRWERGEIGWHQKEVEPELIRHFSHLKPTNVFVPLCGKSKDLIWLLSQGHEVIGVELSEMACIAFFQENEIAFQEFQFGPFKVFQGKGVTLYNGEFFEIEKVELPQLGALYDRAALIALPLELRIKYSQKIIQIVQKYTNKESFEFLQLVLQRIPTDSNGPPFSISFEDLKFYYGKCFDIKLLNCEIEKEGNSNSPRVDQCVYKLSYS